MTGETELPNSLPDLIDVAAADMEKVMADPRYKLNMGTWHEGRSFERACVVCLAGSVMACTLKVPVDHTAWLTDFSYDVSRKLSAINDVRLGYIYDAYRNLGQPPPVVCSLNSWCTSVRDALANKQWPYACIELRVLAERLRRAEMEQRK